MTQGVSATGCGFWVRHSDTCAIFKKGAVILAIAIGAIALVAGVLGQLAFQGFNLGAFNAIATQYLTPTRIFALLFGGSSLLVMGVVTLSLMIYQNRNKELKKEELDSILAQEQVRTSVEWISQKLELRQYWPYNFEANESQRIYAYALIMRHPPDYALSSPSERIIRLPEGLNQVPGVVTVRAFTAWIYLRMHIHKLAQDNYTNGKKAEYSSFALSNEFSQVKLQADQLLATLSEGEYKLLDAPTLDPKLFALLIYLPDKKEAHYFKNAEARVEQLKQYRKRRPYFLKDNVENAKKSAFQSLRIALVSGEFHKYKGTIEGTPITFVSYCVESDIKTVYFLEEEDADLFITNEIPNYTKHISDEERRKALLKTPHKKRGQPRYSSLSSTLSEPFKLEIKSLELCDNEFRIRQADDSTYALIYRKKGSSENTPLYFEQDRLDQKILELKEKGFVNRDEIERVFKACVKEQLLDFELLEPNQYWQTSSQIEGTKVYLFIYRKQNELQYLYFLKREALAEFTTNSAFSPGTLSSSQIKKLSQSVAHDLSSILDQLPPRHYFSQPIGKEESRCFWIVVKHDDGSHLSHFFKKEASLERYITSLPAEYQKIE